MAHEFKVFALMVKDAWRALNIDRWDERDFVTAVRETREERDSLREKLRVAEQANKTAKAEGWAKGYAHGLHDQNSAAEAVADFGFYVIPTRENPYE